MTYRLEGDMRPKLNINKDEFVSMYNKRCLQNEIALHFDISVASVQKQRKLYGLPSRRKSFYTVDENEFKRLYNEGVLLQEIAKKLKISRSYVFCIRKQLELPYRNKAWESRNAKNNERERQCCPDCSSVNIFRSSKKGLYKCRNCNYRFSNPAVRQLSVKYQDKAPALLRNIIENKQQR